MKVYISLWGFHCIKNQEVKFLQNKLDLAILKLVQSALDVNNVFLPETVSLGLLQTERHSIFSVKEIIRLSNFILLGPIHIQKYHSVGIFFGPRYTILGWYIGKIQIDNWSCWKVGHNPVVYHNDSNKYLFLQDNPVKYLIKPPEHFLYHRIETNMVWYFLCYIYIIFFSSNNLCIEMKWYTCNYMNSECINKNNENYNTDTTNHCKKKQSNKTCNRTSIQIEILLL